MLGKPSGDFFHAVLDEVGVASDEALMVGDDVECDVVAAMDIGLQACLIRSGKYRSGDETRAPQARCEASLADLVDALLETR
ncbi:HAD hydrolase-like protein [Halomonas qiaohouensis]|uniref:HAD hydrolase-like protein n=1 Tax=Franzmannia qiaohouensis TaxID=1329370 RepID=A0ABU1HBH0_9GAMM|nr:HAD hydrolase-like protein [Halomonas qiaohouensis]MDR5904790.1 HAD hydrolase-like protein [Halomonas qiaohouensis]